MFGDLIKKLTGMKKRLQNLTYQPQNAENLNVEKENNVDLNIEVLKENNIFKLEISDYISATNYYEKMEEIDEVGLLYLISNSILWNSSKQKIDKGSYYVILLEDYLYNILINEEKIKIDERIKNESITIEKIIFFEKRNNTYTYCKNKHEQNGNTFYTKYFPAENLKGLKLAENEAFNDISSILSNLETIEEINKIIDIEILKKYILNQIKVGVTKKLI